MASWSDAINNSFIKARMTSETQDLLQRELCGTPRLVPSPTPWSAVQTSSGTMCTSARETLHSLLLLTLSSL